MTLGVIDEFRGKGIASKLLDKILEEASQDSRVKYINLHVVSYNPARHFY
jgi:ribosomal protein S18 acetylase RimI-like enzyme